MNTMNTYTTYAVTVAAPTAIEAFDAIRNDPHYAPSNHAYSVYPELPSEYLVDEAWRLMGALSFWSGRNGEPSLINASFSHDDFPFEGHYQAMWFRLVNLIGQEWAARMAQDFTVDGRAVIVPVYYNTLNAENNTWIIIGHRAI